MRILEGVGTLLQLAGLMARLCKMVGVILNTLLPFDGAPLQYLKQDLFKV